MADSGGEETRKEERAKLDVLLAEIVDPNVSHDRMTEVYDGWAMKYDKVNLCFFHFCM